MKAEAKIAATMKFRLNKFYKKKEKRNVTFVLFCFFFFFFFG